jgi:hypothetical protein
MLHNVAVAHNFLCFARRGGQQAGAEPASHDDHHHVQRRHQQPEHGCLQQALPWVTYSLSPYFLKFYIYVLSIGFKTNVYCFEALIFNKTAYPNLEKINK